MKTVFTPLGVTGVVMLVLRWCSQWKGRKEAEFRAVTWWDISVMIGLSLWGHRQFIAIELANPCSVFENIRVYFHIERDHSLSLCHFVGWEGCWKYAFISVVIENLILRGWVKLWCHSLEVNPGLIFCVKVRRQFINVETLCVQQFRCLHVNIFWNY